MSPSWTKIADKSDISSGVRRQARALARAVTALVNSSDDIASLFNARFLHPLSSRVLCRRDAVGVRKVNRASRGDCRY